jgi:N-methylhydantoinase B
VRQVRFLGEQGVLQIRSDKRRFPPYGLAGGQPGTPSMNLLNPGPHEQVLPTMGKSSVEQGDVLRHVMAGGGGWGDPLARDPEAVRQDVADDKLSLAYAAEVYGVVFHADRWPLTVDQVATAARRATSRA